MSAEYVGECVGECSSSPPSPEIYSSSDGSSSSPIMLNGLAVVAETAEGSQIETD